MLHILLNWAPPGVMLHPYPGLASLYDYGLSETSGALKAVHMCAGLVYHYTALELCWLWHYSSTVSHPIVSL